MTLPLCSSRGLNTMGCRYFMARVLTLRAAAGRLWAGAGARGAAAGAALSLAAGTARRSLEICAPARCCSGIEHTAATSTAQTLNQRRCARMPEFSVRCTCKYRELLSSMPLAGTGLDVRIRCHTVDGVTGDQILYTLQKTKQCVAAPPHTIHTSRRHPDWWSMLALAMMAHAMLYAPGAGRTCSTSAEPQYAMRTPLVTCIMYTSSTHKEAKAPQLLLPLSCALRTAQGCSACISRAQELKSS
jgi:hypothetical protein